jgi:hypothetical protein
MKHRNRLVLMIMMLALAAFASSAWATCTTVYPEQMNLHESACIKVCSGEPFVIWLVGEIIGAEGIPVLILEPGCGLNTHCRSDIPCNPVVPPTVFLPDPDYPDCYIAANECITINMCHAHDVADPIWTIEIYPHCDGCFCLTFDHQLSVELRSGLTAQVSSNEVALTWATASETNNARFEISRNGEPVAHLDGMGTSPVGREYHWADRNVQNGVTYMYTLESVDTRGNRHVLGTAGATPSFNAAAAVTAYNLHQNYPNPFNPITSIAFDVVEPARVTLKVYNPMGAEVATLVNGNMGTGRHSVSFDGRNLTSGLYFYSITIGDSYTATRKMLLVK